MPRAKARPGTERNAETLVAALAKASCYDHDVDKIRLVQTHISWVILTGSFAYKVKKPIKLPFLDFRTLESRRRYCTEEVRLNRRLAPELYLGVVPIGGSHSAPRVGAKPAIEYAVKMRQFDTDAELHHRVERGLVTREALVDFATRLAEFHGGLAALDLGTEIGRLSGNALDNIGELARYLPKTRERDIAALRSWTEQELACLGPVFGWRAAAGAYKECHGDLHLKNLLWRDGAIVAFDALEFDRRLREIDVISEAAFLAMDLIVHRRPDLSHAFLNGYLEASGDYSGVHVLRFHLVYRALVRAKVEALGGTQGARARGLDRYLGTALELCSRPKPLLIITHGLSGSGKTHVTEKLVGTLPALRVRSDLERKRLHGLAAFARTGSGVGQGVYTSSDHERTYTALAGATDTLLRHGFNAIVDAAFLRRSDRWAFRQLAAANGARFAILEATAPTRELRRRVVAREAHGRDASEANLAVLDHQLRNREPLDRAERRATIRVATHRSVGYRNLLRRLANR